MTTAVQLKAPNSAAYSEMLTRFLHPRMIAEHVFSGGGKCMHRSIRSMVPGIRFAGRALTVATASGFNRRPLEALALAGKGDVLIIAGGGEAEVAVWGGMSHWNASRKGVAVVTEGMTRDLAEIKAFENPTALFACGQVPAVMGFGTPTSGTVGETVVCGGVQVRTGDLIYGDDDGVVAVPWEQAEAVLDIALKCITFDDKEQAWVESGRDIADLLKMLWDPDGTAYKERKYRWAAKDGVEPL